MHAQKPSHSSSNSTSDSRKPKSDKPAKPIQNALSFTWGGWLFYRLLIMPICISFLSIAHPDIAGGIFWHGLWLVPAFVMTPWMMTGKSPYALLMGSLFTLIYLGASGVTLFVRFYGSIASLLVVYAVDVCFLLTIHLLMFQLLKRLPKMNV